MMIGKYVLSGVLLVVIVSTNTNLMRANSEKCWYKTMPKPKSEKTLLREKFLAERILKYEEYIKIDARPVLNAVIYKAKIKSPSDQVVIRKAKFNYPQAAYLRKLRKEMDKAKGLMVRPEGSYLFGSLMGLSSILKIVQPLSNFTRTHKIAGQQFNLLDGSADLVTQVLAYPYTDEAVAWTWPDELGWSKVYMHKDSFLLRSRFPKLGSQYVPDGLNRNALTNCTDWKILSGYIETRERTFGIVPVPTVCEIVKALSANLLAAEQQSKSQQGAKW